jgi:hypothetical protein
MVDQKPKTPWWFWVIGAFGFIAVEVGIEMIWPEHPWVRFPFLAIFGSALFFGGKHFKLL